MYTQQYSRKQYMRNTHKGDKPITFFSFLFSSSSSSSPSYIIIIIIIIVVVQFSSFFLSSCPQTVRGVSSHHSSCPLLFCSTFHIVPSPSAVSLLLFSFCFVSLSFIAVLRPLDDDEDDSNNSISTCIMRVKGIKADASIVAFLYVLKAED
jgi:hypothetical protein